MEEKEKTRDKVREILSILRNEYPDFHCTLNFSNPFELLIATILAAQCTDERVNEVTEKLFKKYRSARDYLGVDIATLEEDIRPTGFYRNKSKAIRNCCQSLVENFGGEVPGSLEEMVKLPGVGRKTANLVLGSAFEVPGIVVDTHVRRLSGRLGLSEKTDPDDIESDLMAVVPRDEWTDFSWLLIFHGRRVCKAKKPDCPGCTVGELCPSRNLFI